MMGQGILGDEGVWVVVGKLAGEGLGVADLGASKLRGGRLNKVLGLAVGAGVRVAVGVGVGVGVGVATGLPEAV